MPIFTFKGYLPRPDHLYHSLTSRQQRPKVDRTTVELILAECDLKLTAHPQAPLGGGRSSSLIVQTSQGKKILKQYKESLGQSTIIQEHSILTYLAKVNFPSPRLVATKTGETLLKYGEERHALFDFVEGGFQYNNYLLLPGQTRRFIMTSGEMLARLHNQLRDFVPQGYNPDGFKSHNEDRERDLAWFLGKLAQSVAETSRQEAGTGQNHQAVWLLQKAEYLEETLVQLDVELKQADLPRVIIHADYGPYNLLFRKNGSAVILDFEMARLDWRVTDLVQAWRRFSHDRLGFRFNKMKYLLDGYQKHLKLTPDEVQFLPAVWKFFYIRQSILYWHYYCETQVVSWLISARRDAERANWITDNQGKFVEIF